MKVGPKRRTVFILGAVILAMMAISLVLDAFLDNVEPWPRIALGLQAVAVVIL